MEKFKKVQEQIKSSIERHLEMDALVSSSSDEEDEINEEDVKDVLHKTLSAYGGHGIDVEKVISHLINLFQSDHATCLICISTIKKIDPIWNCSSCYAFLHLPCILRWINDSLSYKRANGITPVWSCPKCRMECGEDQIPRLYKCFCEKAINPSYQPWIIPHSCGETCGKLLQPECGHKCLLLCHPGPCPPCAATVSVKCYCQKLPPQLQRCNDRGWSCGNLCNEKYESCSHSCDKICHSGECPPCMETVVLQCHCKSNKKERNCYEGEWKCEKVCNKKFSCDFHSCESTCHLPGDCGDCPLQKNRTCPCGKKQYQVSCKQIQVPTCGDTCGKLLDCGSHFCNMRCHTDRCGQCLEVIPKTCKCGNSTKEIACVREFHCNRKCTQMRLCGKHLCNKKCCDCISRGTAISCEKTCENLLNCRKHKCCAPCHSGPCYPCIRMDTIQCRCGNSKITVLCNAKQRIKSPPCNKLCKIPPDCHHNKRDTHKCHQGPCPPCKKICGIIYKRCGHSCLATCHTNIVRINENKKQASKNVCNVNNMKLKTSCPPCEVPVLVTCLGDHETCRLPCHSAKPSSCGRICGQALPCGNHTCQFICHKVSKEPDNSIPCMECEEECLLPRPTGCTHKCQQPCHSAPCKPCKQLVRISCHCGISFLYQQCIKLTSATSKERNELLKCGNQCPKNYLCGHRCIDNCHPGTCKNEEKCSKKVKLWCKCKRIKKDFPCSLIKKKHITVDCDDVCDSLENERNQMKKAMAAKKREEEELRNREEIEKFEKKFKPRQKRKDKYENFKECQENSRKNNAMILTIAIIFISIVTLYVTAPVSYLPWMD